ncbi:hypothetical protein ACV07N_10455 [Roseivirga echinicomitans]
MMQLPRILICICLGLISIQAFSQQSIREGIIKYKELKEPSKEPSLIDALPDSPLEFSFSDHMFYMNRFNLNRIATYKPSKNPSKGNIVHYSLFDIPTLFTNPNEEDFAKEMYGIDIGKFESIKYDKRDTKVILGYECYRANLKLADGSEQVYYITEKIKASGYQHLGQNEGISGYPLEIQLIKDGSIDRVFKAVEIISGLPEDQFALPYGPLNKRPMHEAPKSATEISIAETPFAFEYSILKDMFSIAYKLNEKNLDAVMQAEGYKLAPEENGEVSNWYRHPEKTNLQIIKLSNDTTNIYSIQAGTWGKNIDQLLKDFEDNDILLFDKEEEEITSNYYFSKEGSVYVFKYQTIGISIDTIFIYKEIKKGINSGPNKLPMPPF